MSDAITVQIIRNKISSLMEEMDYHFYRSGYSQIIRESRDFSCVILDKTGRLVVAPPTFLHGPVYKHLVGRILQIYDGRDEAHTIRAGDVFVCNHPYEGGLPHASDMAFVAPAFHDGELVAFAGSIAHKVDIGGAIPGSTSATATELYQEGLLLPPLKIWDGGRELPDIERLILTNSRAPVVMRGDIRAQIAVTQMGARRVGDICSRFGADTMTSAFAAILKGTADDLQKTLRALPDGVSSAQGYYDSDGVDVDTPILLAVTVTVKDGRISFDFSGSNPQVRGPVNLRPAMIEACVFYSLIASLDVRLPYNDALRDIVPIIYGERTVTNAQSPAPCSSYALINQKVIDIVLEALAHFNPRRAIANSGSTSVLGITWSRGRPGQSNMQYEIHCSGYGAGMGRDGASGTAVHLSNLHITPIEILETEYPCRITRYALAPNSGGAGKWRGALSIEREYELLEDAVVLRRYDRSKYPPKGIKGGEDGSASRFIVAAGTPAQADAPGPGRYPMKTGDKFIIRSAGGGGYGDPRERDTAAIKKDIEESYATAEGARAHFGSRPL